MRQFVFGFIAALTLIAVGGLSYVALGLTPVATASAALPFEKRKHPAFIFLGEHFKDAIQI